MIVNKEFTSVFNNWLCGGERKPMLVLGRVGVGKTFTVEMLLNKYDIVRINCSTYAAQELRKKFDVVGAGFEKPTAIVFDNAEVLSADMCNEMQLRIIKAKKPVVVISSNGEVEFNHVFFKVINFTPLNNVQIKQVLIEYYNRSGIRVLPMKLLDDIAVGCDGDVRVAIDVMLHESDFIERPKSVEERVIEFLRDCRLSGVDSDFMKWLNQSIYCCEGDDLLEVMRNLSVVDIWQKGWRASFIRGYLVSTVGSKKRMRHAINVSQPREYYLKRRFVDAKKSLLDKVCKRCHVSKMKGSSVLRHLERGIEKEFMDIHEVVKGWKLSGAEVAYLTGNDAKSTEVAEIMGETKKKRVLVKRETDRTLDDY